MTIIKLGKTQTGRAFIAATGELVIARDKYPPSGHRLDLLDCDFVHKARGLGGEIIDTFRLNRRNGKTTLIRRVTPVVGLPWWDVDELGNRAERHVEKLFARD